MDFGHLSRHRSAHDKPHQQLHALGAGFAHEVVRRGPSQSLRVADNLLQTDTVEVFVDEPGALAVELVGKAAGGHDDYTNVFVIVFDSAPDGPAKAVATAGTRQWKLDG